MAIFNGLVTGGAETGSSGALDDNFAYSARIFSLSHGATGDSANWPISNAMTRLATRIGAGFANSTINRMGSTEFKSVRVVDSGAAACRTSARRASMNTRSTSSRSIFRVSSAAGR